MLSAHTIVAIELPFSDDMIYNIKIEADIKSETIVDGETMTNKLASPSLTTFASGSEAKLKVTSSFVTEISGHENETRFVGNCGTILKITPMTKGTFIFLKGSVEILEEPTKTSSSQNQSVAVQESTVLQFSLKLENNKPLKMTPVELPDGQKILIEFNAYVVGDGISKEEMRKKALEAKNKGKVDLFEETTNKTEPVN